MLGKTLAPLNIRLKNVKWGEYRIGNLFQAQAGDVDLQQKDCNGKGVYLINSGLDNCGVKGRTDRPARVFQPNTITIDFWGNAFYRNFQYKMATHNHVFSLSGDVIKNERIGIFIATQFSYMRQLFSFDYMGTWNKIKKMNICLPQTSDGKIDFDFMEEFVCELEESHLRELEAYLLATGLNDYQLSQIDRSALRGFKNIRWQEFRVGDLFDRIITVKLTYKAKELPQQPIGEYTLPCLTSSFMNQGLNYYAPRKGATILNNVISIPSNSDVYRAYYQSRDFTVLSDAYAIQWIYDTNEITSKQYLFMVACINKVTDLPIYSYKNKLGGWNVVKDKYISLPATADGQPDLAVMEELVTAMQKIAITDVAKFTAQHLEAPQQIAESSNVIPIYDEYHEGCIPLYTLRAACGYFEDGEVPEEEGWVDATGNGFTPDPKRHFVVHAKGDSMFPKIKNGDFCIFEWYLRQNGRIGSREGEIVLAQCCEFDADYDGKYTIKKYHSEKVVTEESWYHTKIELQPINKDPKYSILEFGSNESDCIIGVFVCVL